MIYNDKGRLHGNFPWVCLCFIISGFDHGMIYSKSRLHSCCTRVSHMLLPKVYLYHDD